MTRTVGLTALALVIAGGSFALVRHLTRPAPPRAAAMAAAGAGELCPEPPTARARPAAELARALAALGTAAPAARPALALAALSDLDELRQRTPQAETIRAALSREVSRAGAPCLIPGQPASLLEVRFQVRATPEEAVARGPTINLQQGAPLPPELQSCLERHLAGPLVARAHPDRPFPPFEGQARVELSYE